MDNNSEALIKPGYDPALTNQDLAPLKKADLGLIQYFCLLDV